MCIIIDANAAHYFARPTRASPATPIIDWLTSGQGRLAIGGRNTEELATNGAVARWLVGLERAGRVRRIASPSLLEEERALHAAGACVSDDAHVIALARLSGARLLFSMDRALHADFKNRDLVSPRGKVYQRREDRRLLRQEVCRRG